MEDTTAGWIAFGSVMGCMLAIDLFSHRGGRENSEKAAIIWSVVWIAVGVAFCGVVYAVGADGTEYLAAYAMEKCLSLDNLFLFLLIFRTLNIPDERQHTALAWGIFGALVFRALFIMLGVSALERWDFARYVFGALLLGAAVMAFRHSGEGRDSRLVSWLSRHLPVSPDAHTNRFVTRYEGKRVVSPLLVALVAVELSDIAFAIDSVPAALSITRDRFVVYSSNAFALLGLRSLYLAAHTYLDRLHLLHYGLAAVLGFAAVKLVWGETLDLHPALSILVIVSCIGAAAIASVVSSKRRDRHGSEPAFGPEHAAVQRPANRVGD